MIRLTKDNVYDYLGHTVVYQQGGMQVYNQLLYIHEEGASIDLPQFPKPIKLRSRKFYVRLPEPEPEPGMVQLQGLDESSARFVTRLGNKAKSPGAPPLPSTPVPEMLID